MATVSERISGAFENARAQINGFEKGLEKKVAKLEKKAKAQLDEVKDQVTDVPAQLKGAWEGVIARLKGALQFATREELSLLDHRVDELAKKVEKLVRGEKIRAAASKGTAKKV